MCVAAHGGALGENVGFYGVIIGRSLELTVERLEKERRSSSGVQLVVE